MGDFGKAAEAVALLEENQPGSAFVVEELTGPKRTVTMTGWCLPVRPVSTETKQRISKHYYPGATVATVQVLGPEHGETDVRGTLRTRYMSSGTYMTLTTGGTTEIIQTASYARKVLTDILKAGQPLRVRWSRQDGSELGVTQYGFATSVKFNEHRAEVIEWEVEFAWTADGELIPQTQVVPLVLSPRNLLDSIRSLIEALNAAMDSVDEMYRTLVTDNIRAFNALLADVGGLVERVLDLAGRPADTAKDTLTTCGNVRQTILDVQTRTVAFAARYETGPAFAREVPAGVSWIPLRSGRDPSRDSPAWETRVAEREQAVSSALRKVQRELNRLEISAARSLTPSARTVYRVRQGDTLRKLAMRFYGTQDRWTTLAKANGLERDDLTPGMALTIPETQT